MMIILLEIVKHFFRFKEVPSMERTKKLLCIMTVVFCLPALYSCLITTLDTVWKDPQYQGGKLNKILVIGVAKNQTIRRFFEDEFVTKLENYGSDAISSYKIIPTEEMLDERALKAKIEDLDINAVLITRLVDKKKERTEYVTTQPGPGYRYDYRPDWYGYYSRSYSYSVSSVRYSEYEVLKIETNVYDAETSEMIWSALSDTVSGGSNEVELRSVIKVIAKSLSDSELI